MALGGLSAHGWYCVLTLLVFGLRHASTGTYGLLSGASSQRQNGDLWESSHR